MDDDDELPVLSLLCFPSFKLISTQHTFIHDNIYFWLLTVYNLHHLIVVQNCTRRIWMDQSSQYGGLTHLWNGCNSAIFHGSCRLTTLLVISPLSSHNYCLVIPHVTPGINFSWLFLHFRIHTYAGLTWLGRGSRIGKMSCFLWDHFYEKSHPSVTQSELTTVCSKNDEAGW